MSEHHHDDEHGPDYWVHTHISGVKLYLGILGVLLSLTAVTVAIYPDATVGELSFTLGLRLGGANLVIAMLIATVKASLVCYFFMHMQYEQKFNVVFFLGSIVFAGVFLAYTSNDTAHRGEFDEYNGTYVNQRTGAPAAGGLDDCSALTPPSLRECTSSDVCGATESCNEGICRWRWPCSWQQWEAEHNAAEAAAAEDASAEGTQARAPAASPVGGDELNGAVARR